MLYLSPVWKVEIFVKLNLKWMEMETKRSCWRVVKILKSSKWIVISSLYHQKVWNRTISYSCEICIYDHDLLFMRIVLKYLQNNGMTSISIYEVSSSSFSILNAEIYSKMQSFVSEDDAIVYPLFIFQT